MILQSVETPCFVYNKFFLWLLTEVLRTFAGVQLVSRPGGLTCAVRPSSRNLNFFQIRTN